MILRPLNEEGRARQAAGHAQQAQGARKTNTQLTGVCGISSGPGDWTRSMPWRSPGDAPVLGSGCGVAGGGLVFNNNGGWPATGAPTPHSQRHRVVPETPFG